MKLRSVTDLTSPEPRSQSVLKISETFVRLATLIQWTEHLVRAFEATSKSQQELVCETEQRDSRSTMRKECLDGVSYLNSNRRESLNMTKTTKAILAGAAFAGLFAGTGAAVKASTLLPSLKTSFSASDQDQNQDQKSEKAKDKKDRHSCKGQNSCKGKGGCKSSDNGCKGKNSCKGKGGCRTDGKPMPDEKAPSA